MYKKTTLRVAFWRLSEAALLSSGFGDFMVHWGTPREFRNLYSSGFSNGISMFLLFSFVKIHRSTLIFDYLSLVLSSSQYWQMLSHIADFPQSVQVYMLCGCVFVFVYMCWVVSSFVSFYSPLTMAVTWSLPTPIRFLTSQTKVVFTASSTFSTFSSLPLICTVSGISPERLQGHKHIGMWRREREQEMRKGF